MMTRLIKAIASLLALTGFAAAARAEIVVLQASGPSARHFPVGARLPDNVAARLTVGDMLRVRGAMGIRTFRGPGIFRLRLDPSSPPLTRRPRQPNSYAPAPPRPSDAGQGGPLQGFIICPNDRRCPH